MDAVCCNHKVVILIERGLVLCFLINQEKLLLFFRKMSNSRLL